MLKMNSISRALTFCFLLVLCCPAWSHHTTATTSTSTTTMSSVSSSRNLFLQSNKTKPNSRVSLVYDFALLDSSVGQLHNGILNAEWAAHRRFSLLINTPMTFLSHNFRNDALGFGDFSIGGKFLILDNPKYFMFASAWMILPTGDSSSGLGRSSTGQQLELFMGTRFSGWTFFLSPSTSFSYGTPHSPQLNILSGASSPTFFDDKIYLTLSLITPIHIRDDALENGSWKLYAEPQINWIVDSKKHLTLSLAMRLALIDQLSRKSGITLSNTSNILLGDSIMGVTAGVHYSF